MNKEDKKINSYQQALLDATMNSLLYGHGFIRVTHDNGFIVTAIPIDEYPDISELMKFISDKNNRFGE